MTEALFIWLLELALKSLLLALVILVILRILQSRSAADRSFIAHAGMMALLALIPASLLMPDLSVLPRGAANGMIPVERILPAAVPVETGADGGQPANELATDIPQGVISAGGSAPGASLMADWRRWLPGAVAALYLIPVGLLLTGFLLSLAGLFRLRKTADIVQAPEWLGALAKAQASFQFREGAALLASNRVTSPISWGFIRPVIVIDRATVAHGADHATGIVAHELAHLIRGDWLKLMIGRLAVALFWFNPLVWKLAGEAHQLREEATDDAVLSGGAQRTRYAELLVDAARHDNGAGVVAAHGVAAGKHSLRRRVERILDEGASRRVMTRQASIAAVVIVAAVAAPVAALTFEAPAPAVAGMPLAAPSPAPVVAPVPEPAPQAAPVIVAQADTAVIPAEAVRMGPDGKRQLDVDTIIAMQVHNVTPAYRAEINAAYPGLGTLSPEQLIAFSVHGVDGAFLRGLRELGFENLDADEVTQAAVFDLSPATVGDLRALGFGDLDFDELIQFRVHDIDADYVQAFRDAGYRDLTVDEIIQLAVFDVDVRDLERAGQFERE